MMKARIAGALSRPETWLALLATWLTLSALRSFHTLWAQAALTEWLRWMAGIGIAVTLAYARPSALFFARMAVILVGGIAGFGAWQGLVPAKGGLAGPFLDHQLCGSALLVLLPWTLALGFRDPNTKWRWTAQIVATAGLVSLALSLTRSAWVGAAVVAVFLGSVSLSRIQDRRHALRQSVLGLSLVLGICFAFFLAIQPTELSSQFSKRTATLRAVDHDLSWQARQPRWRGAARMAAVRPAWGWGLGRYPGLQSAWTGQGRDLGPTVHPSLSEQAHDLYLQTAAETGLIGLLLYLGVMLTIGARCFQVFQSLSYRRESLRAALLLSALAVLIGQAVDALANPAWQYGEVSLFWWAGVGMALQIARAPLTSTAQSGLAMSPKRQRFLLMTSSAFLAPFILAFVQPNLLLLPAEAYSPPSSYPYYQGQVRVTASPTVLTAPGTVTLKIEQLYGDKPCSKSGVCPKDSQTQWEDATSDGQTMFLASCSATGTPVQCSLSGNMLTIYSTTRNNASVSIQGNSTTPSGSAKTSTSITVNGS